jgi:SAM-dependent methyltransferase
LSRLIWKIQSSFYKVLRKNLIFHKILEKENQAIQSLLTRVDFTSSSKVLDIGTGRGNTLTLVPVKEFFCVGLDNIYSMVYKCKLDFPEVHFINADGKSIPFHKSVFDLVLCVGVSEYVHEIDKLIRSINEILKLNGHCVFTLSPPKFTTYLRWVNGHRLYPQHPYNFEKLLVKERFLQIDCAVTPFQIQYLLQKSL